MSENFDYGPLRTYEITWTSGHVETIQAHQISRSGGSSIFTLPHDRIEPARVDFHGEIGGRWRLVLSAREEDIRTIRDIALEDAPGGAR